MRFIILAFVMVATGCASTPQVPSRTISISAESDVSGVMVYIPDGRFGKLLGRTPFTLTMSLPATPIAAYAGKNLSYIVTSDNSITIPPDATQVNLNFTALNADDQYAKEFREMPKSLRAEIVKIIGMYDVVVASPNFMKKAKGAEAKAAINAAMVNDPSLRDLHIYQALAALDGQLDISIFLGDDNLSDNISQLKKATGQL